MGRPQGSRNGKDLRQAMTSQPPTTPSQGEEAVPTCYRHPERETYVRCQRCDRPICPDCMRDAAVGHQCVECVAEANRATRGARTVFGGGLIAKPYVTFRSEERRVGKRDDHSVDHSLKEHIEPLSDVNMCPHDENREND